ncbi:hypothetical protein [Bradyrhizobium sp. 169]|uniref:hypothetical protein n=1 Tax=Bradyrhizobium sp. 169 TaxID=2782640 RepID=UPI001FF96729|nr:hypothetical protein [Bradyrhizobium sp. 169]MCK1590332.1 hypothetical protein [Bradyrhizobium sp. 169]
MDYQGASVWAARSRRHFRLFVAAKIKTEGKGPSKAGERLINRYMAFCVILLLASGLLSAYDGCFIQENKRLSKIRETTAHSD